MSNRSNNSLADHSLAKVFFALWPTSAESGQLSAWQASLKILCGGRVMRTGMLHATLAFIGNIEQARLEALQLAAQEVSGECFELCFDVARYWGHNHIVYAAPARVPKQLHQLVGALEQQLTRHRFEFDVREYKPHVTLLRNAGRSDTPLPEMQTVCWKIKDFALVQSANQEYLVLAKFPLNHNKESQEK